ncbi:MAG: hypothetical protein KatS3mg054_1194 [Chloroflexus sp.]|nr:MAG: hypothetical protein KatS3mg054_1194 [Chloroflexus sp.]
MSDRQVLLNTKDEEATYLWEYWIENGYVYFAYSASIFKNVCYWDMINEQSTRV